jgi:hypothetical protein
MFFTSPWIAQTILFPVNIISNFSCYFKFCINIILNSNVVHCNSISPSITSPMLEFKLQVIWGKNKNQVNEWDLPMTCLEINQERP